MSNRTGSQVPLQLLLGVPVLGFGPFGQLQELAKRRFRVGRWHLIALDEDPSEDGLVELPANMVRGRPVEPVAVGHQLEGGVQSHLGGAQLGVQPRQPGLGGGDLARDALLLALQQVKGHRSGVVRLHELLALRVQFAQPSAQAASFGGLLGLGAFGQIERSPAAV